MGGLHALPCLPFRNEHLAANAEAPQRLHRPEVGGGSRCIPRHNYPAFDERLVKDDNDDGDQVHTPPIRA